MALALLPHNSRPQIMAVASSDSGVVVEPAPSYGHRAWRVIIPPVTTAALAMLGLLYVPFLFNFVALLAFLPGDMAQNRYLLIYLLAVTKFSDVGAYVIGSLIGRHKMIPRISPGKTWEGFGGAIAVSTGASLVFVHFFGAHMYDMNALHAVILGVVLSSTAVIGDLIESLFKREAGVKDSGKFFPGIGGTLDLLDSLLFNAPIMYLYLRHILTHP